MKKYEIDEYFYAGPCKNAIRMHYSNDTKAKETLAIITMLLGCKLNSALHNIVVLTSRSVEAEHIKIIAHKLFYDLGYQFDKNTKKELRIRGNLFIFTGIEDNYYSFNGYNIDAVIEP